MMGGPPVYYPPAGRGSAYWYQDTYPGTDMGGLDKLLIHSTEGGGWPSYDGGAKAPQLTYDPQTRAWRQHFYVTRSARALRDDTGTVVRENRDRVLQVEIIGTCDPATHRKHPDWPYIPELADENLDDLAELFAWCHVNYDMPLVAAPIWLPYPDSYGDSAARMTGPEYDRAKGLLGHEHASGNEHGDPGKLDAPGIVSRAKVLVSPPPVPTPEPAREGTMYVIKYDGKAYLVGGLLRRYIPGAPGLLADLEAAYGPGRTVTRDEFALYTPADTMLAIQSDTRVDVADVEALERAEAPQLAGMAASIARIEAIVTAGAGGPSA